MELGGQDRSSEVVCGLVYHGYGDSRERNLVQLELAR